MSNPIAIISDIHGNSPALRAVLEDIRRFDCEQIFVIGDVINGPDPAGCVDLLLATPNITALKGNAEHGILIPDLDKFPQSDDPFFKDIIELGDWWIDHLGPSRLAWIQTWPDFMVWNGWLLVHDSPKGRMYPQTRYVPGVEEKYQEMFYHDRWNPRAMDDAAVKRLSAFMDDHSVSGLFTGHTHEAFFRAMGDKMGNKFVCNTGSVGMPLDGDPRPAWVLAEGVPFGVGDIAIGRIDIRRIEYDVTEAFVMVDNTPHYQVFKVPGRADAFKKMYETGIYWGVHLRQGV